jgi:hypothetical protein
MLVTVPAGICGPEIVSIEYKDNEGSAYIDLAETRLETVIFLPQRS